MRNKAIAIPAAAELALLSQADVALARNPVSDGLRNFCVIGSGISGLSVAFLLSEYRDAKVTVYERDDVFGGRANVTSDGEHCPRMFLSDYMYLLNIFKTIRCADGRTLHDNLRPVKRFCYTEAGWLETSQLYVLLAKELPLVERIRIMKARRESPLIAAQTFGPNTNRYGSLKDYRPASVARLAVNLFRVRRTFRASAFAFDGPTDECLTGPWIRHLQDRGVTFHSSNPIHMLRSEPGRVRVCSARGWQNYDAVVVTAFVSDMVDLLTRSSIDHAVNLVDHIHCKCLTVTLDPREKVLIGAGVRLYCHGGINIVLQPEHSRCIVLCTHSAVNIHPSVA